MSKLYVNMTNTDFIGQFSWDVDGLTQFVSHLYEAPQGTLARQVADDWAELLVTLNVSKLYNTPEIFNDME